METREDAIVLLRSICSDLPGPFFSKVEESQKGVGFVLSYLVGADNEVIAGELARKMNVSTARIAAVLKTMEKNGLITRYNSSEDARRTVVKLTPAGMERAAEIREQILQKIEILLEKVGKVDLEEFLRVARKIKTAVGE